MHSGEWGPPDGLFKLPVELQHDASADGRITCLRQLHFYPGKTVPFHPAVCLGLQPICLQVFVSFYLPGGITCIPAIDGSILPGNGTQEVVLTEVFMPVCDLAVRYDDKAVPDHAAGIIII